MSRPRRARAGIGSIAFRIWLPFASIILAMLMFASLYYPSARESAFRDSTMERISELARVTALGVELALESDNYAGLARTIAATTGALDFAFVALVQRDADGVERVFASNPVRMDTTVILNSRRSGDYVTSDVSVSTPQFTGVVRVGASRQRIAEEVAELNRPVYQVSLIMLLASLLVVTWVARAVSKPIVALTRVAESLAKGDYDVDIPRTQVRAEVGELTQALVGLREALREARERMDDYVQGVLRAKEAAEDTARAKSYFVANVTHEIRTPINAVIGLSHLCLGTELTPKQHDYLTKIERASRSLIALANDVLDFSKLEAEAVVLEQERFRLDEVLTHVEAVVGGLASAQNLSFGITLAENVPLGLVGDALRLQQVLMNLTGNAIKFTQAGSVRIAVSASAISNTHAMLSFRVMDTGIGMDSALLGRLFQPFVQADASTTRTYGGTGLGLVISDRLVRAMGGRIAVESAPGAGSSFTFVVEFAIDDAESRDAAPANALGGRALVPSFPGARILLVEDNPFNQMVAREMIERTGASVRVAQNGEEGLEAVLADLPFNLILMDIQMPVMDGYESTRRIRQTPEGSGPVILAMTANVTPEDRARCRAAGMEDFVPKPIVPEHLYAVLGRWLRVVGASPAVVSDVRPEAPLPASAHRRVLAERPTLLYDDGALDELVGNDQAFIAELVQEFITSATDTLAGWRTAADAKDLAEIGRLGHRFKSAAAMIGAMSLRDHAEALERLGKAGEASGWPEAVEHVRALEGLIATLSAQLRQRLDVGSPL